MVVEARSTGGLGCGVGGRWKGSQMTFGLVLDFSSFVYLRALEGQR
jgi:hypothetical protein